MSAPCGCCEVLVPGQPRLHWNRPGLDALEYRIGTFATFLQGMLDAVATVDPPNYPLRDWTSRHEDDYGVQILELWAYVADIVTFYQERAANEAFLRTAVHRESLLRLAALIDYRPAPGLAAVADLAFTLEPGRSLVIPAGLRVQSVPGPDEKPRKFEVEAPLAAHARLNAFRVFGAPDSHRPLAAKSSRGLVPPDFAPRPPLARGDRLLAYKKGRAGVEEKTLDALVPVDGGTELLWSPPLQASHAGGDMARWSRKCRLFGADAPNQWVQPKTETDGRVTWTTQPSAKDTPYALAAGSQLALDATYENLPTGTEVLVVSPTFTHRARIARIQPAAVRVGPFEGTVSRIELDPRPPAIDDLRLVVVYLLASPDFPFPSRRLDPVVEGSFLYARAADVAGLEPGRTLLVAGADPGQPPRRVVVKRIDPHATPAIDARLGLLRLEVTPPLPRLDQTPVVAHGNVARATDGETVPAEVLGDGDAGTPFARFALARAPLTHVPRPGAPNGAGSTLELRVDGVRWTEIRDLVFAGPRDRVFTTSRDARETTRVHFGDGRTGATPVTGRANIVARYRHGLGRAGNVPARSLRTPLDRPLGLAGSTNPLPAEGGADPESDLALRRNAPNVVRTFGRIVSLRDFEDAAREFPAVGKARAVVGWSGEDQVVYLVVAGLDGNPLGTETLRELRRDLDARRDLHRTLVLETHLPTGVEIVVGIHPAPDRLPDDVRQAAQAALVGRLAFDRVDFGGTLHLAEIYAAVQDTPGVVSVDVDVFRFANAPVALPPARLGTGPLQPYLRFERRELPAVVAPDRHAIVNLLPA